ncbi:4-hydroxybenzoate octaprenyltransferase [Amylibacter marinus]|uniref:4-hydroxybenzoate octaprenyltransferase n=1 Tax=Amylibacter marinus TaxID=1475483 RepID=A0ABQ5VX99_9RHOB|nr:4-hydroxybenzoate octaprenyltransferase [Amylibacter marinus]GLQ35917.1 4-hydroxybenzoate octaprenyltransferase [Amylibacter marinus]
MTENHQTPDQSGRVADAVDHNWVDRFAPVKARPYLRLSRADRPAGTWLLLIPCWWALTLALLADGAAISPYHQWLFVACALGAFLMRGAGCTWNDITDRHLDAQVARTKSRPIPSGQISVKRAALWMAIQTGISALILFSLNSAAILWGIAALLPVAIYPFAKRFTWWPQVFLGVAFNWGALLMWVAYFGTISWAAILLYLSGIAWTLFYDTIYAHQDKEDDALIGIKSTARLFHNNTKTWLFGFLVAITVLMVLALIGAVGDRLNILALVFAIMGIWAFGMHMMWQLRKLDIDDPDICLKLFRANRDAGFLPIAGFALAYAVQISLGGA